MTHSQYPFLFYQDITYLPLTWNHLQALGIESAWGEAEGLRIWTNRNFPRPARITPLVQDLSDVPRRGPFTARLAEGNIALNEIAVDNGSEPYPFLTFQNIIYMPLTWNFVHDILQIDIRLIETGGLELIGGQNVIGPLPGDDDHALYFQSMLTGDPNKAMIKMDKSTYRLEWKSREELEELRGSRSASEHPLAGQPVTPERQDRDLFYGDTKVYTLTDSDVWESAVWGSPVLTAKEYPAGDQGDILSINLKWRIATVGPNYGTTYNFLVRNGTSTELKEFNRILDRVMPNPDGTVWITSASLPWRFGSGPIPGTAGLGLIDRDGQLHIVNERYNGMDVVALGLTNPVLSNPAAVDGSLYVVIKAIRPEHSTPDTTGLYRLNTKLEAERLSSYASGLHYLDTSRTIYIQYPNNTIENWNTGESHTWFDHELAAME
ncbi:hypothetical protein [Paenibacillus koleovorans]|uniref:hypothetical protein n=1 Tax=Paenibacillus koleovorans TaxID=121608 RepID=UPI000FD74ADF|nr:hypothetical protein [Paenibacillus koleovorans]